MNDRDRIGVSKYGAETTVLAYFRRSTLGTDT